MFRTYTAALMMVVAISIVPAAAAEPLTSASTATAAADTLAADTDWSLPALKMTSAPSRGALLPALYISLASLNAYDAFSTKTGLSRGAVEANTAMSGIARNSAALWAVKSVATASSVLMAEHLWKAHHRGQAIAMMVISTA